MRPAPKLTDIPRYPVVTGLSLLAIGVSVAYWAKVDVKPLFETAMIRHGELWRLVTSIFPHANMLHLAFNIYWLWVFGTLVEEVYGHLKVAALILLFSVGSSALQYAFSSGGIGLSGVDYGLFGLVWILSLHHERFRDAVDTATIWLFVAWFFICIVTTVTNIMPVANMAHGAGLALGILTGFAIAQPARRIPFAGMIGLLVVVMLWAATAGRPTLNHSKYAGAEEAQFGYKALTEHRYPEAARWLRDAVIYQPKDAAYWYDLAIAYQGLKRDAESLAAYQKAAELGYVNAQYMLGLFYENGSGGFAKDEAMAAAWYRKAADQGSSDAENGVAWLSATSSDPAVRNPAIALQYALKAVAALKDHPNPDFLDTLAEAYYINGQYQDALQSEQDAIALVDPAPGKPALFATLPQREERLKEFQQRLEKYQRAIAAKPHK